MDFSGWEDRDGVRLSWTVWPDRKEDSIEMGAPLGCMYTPRKKTTNLYRAQYPPVHCNTCGGVLNPFVTNRTDFISKIWVCSFCSSRNHFPVHYNQITVENLPPEMLPQCTTMEYVTAHSGINDPSFVWIVDTCLSEDELANLKENLLQAVEKMPKNSKLAIIACGKHVQLYEISFDNCLKSYIFQGEKEVDHKKFASMLGINQSDPNEKSLQASRFLVSVEEREFDITSILENLQADEWPLGKNERAERSTGVALSLAVNLLEVFGVGLSRISLFLGGPCTIGPGKVVGCELKEQMRSHYDMQKGNVPYFNDAVKYYDRLSKRIHKLGCAVDLFVSSFDQVGMAEMKNCVERSNGVVVLDDTFDSDVFKNTFLKLYSNVVNANEEKSNDEVPDNSLSMCFNGDVSIITSPNVKICGAIGICSSNEKKSSSVSETEIGVGNTCSWHLGSLLDSTTIGFYFNVNSEKKNPNQEIAKGASLQFISTYSDSKGYNIMRVSTIFIPFASMKIGEGLQKIRQGFDQEAAVALMARYAVYRAENEFAFDILRWLDRMLIRLMKRFAEFKPKQPETFCLCNEMSFYPQFMFHLRRSQFLQVFNSSPDETVFYRCVLLTQTVENSSIMVQPSLIAYSLDVETQAVELDVESVAPERILVLDTFFYMCEMSGKTIGRWKEDKVHEMPEYAHFAAPKADCDPILLSRFPHPNFIQCVEGDSKSRFMMTKLNPSITQNDPGSYGSVPNEPKVFTDDVPLKVFMEHLRRLTVE